METSYEKLALFYDQLMQGIDYEVWVSYVEALVDTFQGNIESVVDLACGTGNSTIPWSERGYRTFGVDLSPEMLEIAQQKAQSKGQHITFLKQDLCSMLLPQQVDLAVCFQDGFNYILDENDLASAFQAVYHNLSEGGFFVFDLNYLPQLLPENVNNYSTDEEGYALTWSTRFMEKEKLWEVSVSGIIKGEEEHRFCETHREKIYDTSDVWMLLIRQGFTVMGTYQAFTFSPPHENAPRLVYIAQKTVQRNEVV